MIIPNIWENKTWQPNHQPVTMVKPPNLIGEILQATFLLRIFQACAVAEASRSATRPVGKTQGPCVFHPGNGNHTTGDGWGWFMIVFNHMNRMKTWIEYDKI